MTALIQEQKFYNFLEERGFKFKGLGEILPPNENYQFTPEETHAALSLVRFYDYSTEIVFPIF